MAISSYSELVMVATVMEEVEVGDYNELTGVAAGMSTYSGEAAAMVTAEVAIGSYSELVEAVVGMSKYTE